MDHPRILIQLDSDPQPSVFDAVVAVDAGVEHLFQHANIEPTNVQSLVHGAMFTRGPTSLRHTAIFIGGSNATLGDAIAAEVRRTFFGPVRVSVMVDGNGSNTTAAAAVLCAARHIQLENSNALLLGGTGPVGRRVALLLAKSGCTAHVVSRHQERAEEACEAIQSALPSDDAARVIPLASSNQSAFASAIESCDAFFGCGAAGAMLLSSKQLEMANNAKVAIDLNAVPPAGIEGIAVTDKAQERGKRIDYGAIGVGGLKMKIHKVAIETLFSSNDLFLNAEEIFAIGKHLESAREI